MLTSIYDILWSPQKFHAWEKYEGENNEIWVKTELLEHEIPV